LELRDSSTYFEDVYDDWMSGHKRDIPSAPSDFEEKVTRVMIPEVRLNLTKIKLRTLEYYFKAIMIFRKNFEKHFNTYCQGLMPPVNPFFTLFNARLNSSSKP